MQIRPVVFLFIVVLLYVSSRPTVKVGDEIDNLNGIAVYYNGKNFKHTAGRNLTADGYNLGLKYQCVEFIKRYYYYHYNHKMPNAFGNAKDYFDDNLGDVGFNEKRGLYQYRNVRKSSPKAGDIIVYGPYNGNPYGHLAIVAKVEQEHLEIIQQNWGTETRKTIKIARYLDIVTVADYHIKGWLSLQSGG